MSIEEAIRISTVIYDNKIYTSIKDLCESFNLDSDIINDRIRRGWCLKDAIKTPIRLQLPKGFKKIKIAYTHNNTDYYECIHNNQKYILSIQEMKELSKKKGV